MHRADVNFVTLPAAAFRPASAIAFVALPPSG
jgi:hypothetical protein